MGDVVGKEAIVGCCDGFAVSDRDGFMDTAVDGLDEGDIGFDSVVGCCDGAPV